MFRGLSRRQFVTSAAAAATVWPLGPALAQSNPRSVELVNRSVVTTCAEEDNVDLRLVGSGVRAFRIEALHPPYMDRVTVDSYAPDFSGCNFNEQSHPTDPKHRFTPRRVILWETSEWLMVGNVHETFWRSKTIDFVVGGTVEHGIHLMQLYRKDAAEPKLGRHQFLVLYPSDGYWRGKPLPVESLNYSVYGSSFLVGPIEDDGRPIVNLKRVEFVPETMTFFIDFDLGGQATLRIAEINRERLAIETRFSMPTGANQAFAAVRSMFVTPDNSDVAEVTLRTSADATPAVTSVKSFTSGVTTEARLGRSVISRHNTSAPDLWFGRFEGA